MPLALATEFLEKTVMLIRSFLGDLSEANLRKNFMIIHFILNEMIVKYNFIQLESSFSKEIIF